MNNLDHSVNWTWLCAAWMPYIDTRVLKMFYTKKCFLQKQAAIIAIVHTECNSICNSKVAWRVQGLLHIVRHSLSYLLCVLVDALQGLELLIVNACPHHIHTHSTDYHSVQLTHHTSQSTTESSKLYISVTTWCTCIPHILPHTHTMHRTPPHIYNHYHTVQVAKCARVHVCTLVYKCLIDPTTTSNALYTHVPPHITTCVHISKCLVGRGKVPPVQVAVGSSRIDGCKSCVHLRQCAS